MITWDEPKRKINLKKHRIDLAELESAFDFPMVTVEDDREVYGELRLQSLAMWRGRLIFLVWTERHDAAHLISCRYADRSQIQDYFENLWPRASRCRQGCSCATRASRRNRLEAWDCHAGWRCGGNDRRTSESPWEEQESH